MIAQAAQEPEKPAQTAVVVPEKESAAHLIGNRPILRVAANDGKQISFSSIPVQVTVDITGQVTAARAAREETSDGPFSLEIYEKALSAMRSLHYSPFVREGHPVTATFKEYVFLLPPEIKPSRHVPFPKVKSLKSVKITLQRTACYGSCPAYSVEVNGDGTVDYSGGTFVAFTGHHRGSIPPANVLELLNIFRAADYFSLDDEYRMSVTDNPTYITSIQIDGRRKQVKDYVGLEIGMPQAVSDLENEIDRLSGSERWVRGNQDTLSALNAEHWDFKSSEATATLSRVIDGGSDDAVRDLISAGVPLTGNDGPASPLVFAAYRGDLVMLNSLLEAGAAGHTPSLDMALVAAARSGNVECLRLLVRSGARIDSRDLAGHTVLMAAAGSGASAMVKEVLKYQPDVNAAVPAQLSTVKDDSDSRRDEGRTALMAAVSEKTYDAEAEGVDRAEVVRLLLAAGAEPNARDAHGDTALSLCTERADIALLLINAGADVNVRNDNGMTALENASNEDVKRVLREHGAIDKDQ
jgi:ankyrin repeat protein